MALYPEDAETVETLLSAADAEMYAAKYTRVDKNRAPEAQPDGELTLQGKTSESNGEGFILKGFK
jgi:predicted signal transduction protein with EAL and GGDEF domain